MSEAQLPCFYVSPEEDVDAVFRRLTASMFLKPSPAPAPAVELSDDLGAELAVMNPYALAAPRDPRLMGRPIEYQVRLRAARSGSGRLYACYERNERMFDVRPFG
jgi:hypothetical protein